LHGDEDSCHGLMVGYPGPYHHTAWQSRRPRPVFISCLLSLLTSFTSSFLSFFIFFI